MKNLNKLILALLLLPVNSLPRRAHNTPKNDGRILWGASAVVVALHLLGKIIPEKGRETQQKRPQKKQSILAEIANKNEAAN